MDILVDRRPIIVFVISLLFYSVPVYLSHAMIGGPDDLSFTYTAEQLINKHSFIFDSNYNDIYDTNVFVPRSFVYVSGKGVISIVTPGVPLLLAIVGIILFGFIEYAIPLISAIGVIIFYYFVKENFDQENALVSALLLSTLPVYWNWSIYTYSDIPSIVFLILGLYSFQKAIKTNKSSAYLITGGIIGFWILLRPTNFILFPAIALYLMLNRKKIKNKKGALIGIVLFSSIIFGFLLYNQVMFGDFLKTGYQLYNQPYPSQDILPMQNNNSPKSSITEFIHPKRILWHICNLPLYSAFAAPFFIISLTGLFYSLQNRKDRDLTILVFLILISLVGFFGNLTDYYGIEQNNFNSRSSYLRYLMPAYVLLIMYVYPVLDKLFEKKSLIALIILFIASNISVIFFAPYDNMLQIIAQRNEFYDMRLYLLNMTSPSAVVFTAHYDKVIFPDRTVFGYQRIPQEIRREEMLRITKELLEDGKPVYFIDDIEHELYEELNVSQDYLSSVEFTKLSDEYKFYKIDSVK